MKLRLVMEGIKHTIYEIGDSDELGRFMESLKRHGGKQSVRLVKRLDQLANAGASQRHEEYNALGYGLFEAKTKYGARVAFFYDAGYLVICANVYLKQTDRAPRSFIETARSRKHLYEEAKARRERVDIVLGPAQVMPRRIPTWST